MEHYQLQHRQPLIEVSATVEWKIIINYYLLLTYYY